MKTKTKVVKHSSMTYKVFCYLVFVMAISGVVSAGFGSTYIPEINGTNTLQIQIGSNSDYYIYPQNSGDKILLVKIKMLNGSNLISNTLQETYEVPVNTESDEFPIKINFRLENNTELIGKEFFVSYELLSTYKTNDTGGLVTFSPIGYTKSFYIMGMNISNPPAPVNNTPTPTPTSTPTQQSSGNRNNEVIISTPAINKTIPKPQENPTPITNDEPKTTIQETPISVSNTWIYLLVIGGICVLTGIIFAVRWFHNRDNNYPAYNGDNEEVKYSEFDEIK
jgi:hypothetical protein